MEPWQLAVVLLAAVAAAAALVAAWRSGRRTGDEAGAPGAAQLTDLMDRFHRQLGEFGRQLAESQGSAGAALSAELAGARAELQRQLQTLAEGVSGQLLASQRDTAQVFGSLKGQLGQVAQMAARMEELGQGLDELEKVLKVPKLRGLLGEQTLEEILRQVLPPAFWELQHRFADGRTVDAVIRLGDRLLPVDAKFPLEAYRRLVAAADDDTRRVARRDLARAFKGRVDELASRYLRPGEGTLDLALLFLPAEGVYYEIVTAAGESETDLLGWALARRVVPVSPASFHAYLRAVMTGLRGVEVDRRAGEIARGIEAVGRELELLQAEIALLGRHLHNASGRFAEVERRAGRLQDRVAAVGGLGDPASVPAADLRDD